MWRHSQHALEAVRPGVHNGYMQVETSRQFKRWVEDLAGKASSGDQIALRAAQYVRDELGYLTGIEHEPHEDTATLKWIRQKKKYRAWRLSHPFDMDMAIRIICWFPPDEETVVVILFAGDKAPMGDVFYDSVGTRADQAIDQWKRERRATQ